MSPQQSVFTIAEFNAMKGASDEEKLLSLAFSAKDDIEHVIEISGFRVGAAMLTSEGVYLGVNLEGEEMGLTLHAEQSAVHNMISHRGLGTGVVMVGITAAPCGLCRQLMSELPDAQGVRIILPDSVRYTLGELLPNAFSPKLVDLPPLGRVESPSFGPSQSSWACCPASVTLAFTSGRKSVSGYFLESVAHNGSVPAVTGALNVCLLQGGSLSDVASATLTVLKQEKPKLNHLATTKLVLSTFCPQLKGAVEVVEV
eukprot:TRINITY_DN6294_c0_g1_i1.p1 TRINITY_DN6294_c0_g1~~TRINITY_DN6294_c0_g1_i1.p1  ORF type:complete len:257 (+),score=37.39 TRINITY_DN6294_c0_g1_i1:68-838(+)